MRKVVSKIVAVAARAWALPRAHKLIIAGVVAVGAILGHDFEPSTVEALGSILMVIHEVTQ